MKTIKMKQFKDRKVQQYCRFGEGWMEICTRDQRGTEIVIRHDFKNDKSLFGTTKIRKLEP